MFNWRETYLGKVFLHSKLLFSVIVLFVVFQIFFTYKGVESFPFLNYGMYSEYFSPNTKNTCYQISIDNQPIKLTDQWDLERSIIESTLGYYDGLKSNNFQDTLSKVIDRRFKYLVDTKFYNYLNASLLNDKNKVATYPRWLMQYMADMRMVNQPKIVVLKNTVDFKENALQLIQSDTLINYCYAP